MSPRSSTLLALALVLLAGIPLPALTGTHREAAAGAEQPAPAGAGAADTRDTFVTVRFSGQPSSLRLLHGGHELARLPQEEAASQLWELDLALPATPELELEVEAGWPQGSGAQAVTLTLEPDRLPERSCTHWSGDGSPTLHRLYSFSW